MSKRGENIRKRKDGRWESRYLDQKTGRYKYFYAESYSAVKRKRYEYALSASEDFENTSIKNVTLSMAFDSWLREHKASVKMSTYINYENIVILYLKPLLGDMRICSVTAEAVNEVLHRWLGNEGSVLSPKYIHDILSVLKTALAFVSSKYGIDIKIGGLYSVSVKRNELTVLTEEEQKRLHKYLTDSCDYAKLGIILCLYTGMRIGEICALKWSDISISGEYIDINKTLFRTRNINNTIVNGKIPKTIVAVGKPKTDASVRRIPLCDFTLELLAKTGTYNGESYFLTDSGKYMDPRTYQNKFKKYLSDAKIADVNFHILRHTFATNCIAAGCDVKSLSEILGHSSVKVTLDRYVHPTITAKKNQLNKLAVYCG